MVTTEKFLFWPLYSPELDVHNNDHFSPQKASNATTVSRYKRNSQCTAYYQKTNIFSDAEYCEYNFYKRNLGSKAALPDHNSNIVVSSSCNMGHIWKSNIAVHYFEKSTHTDADKFVSRKHGCCRFGVFTDTSMGFPHIRFLPELPAR